jgi:competence protein ComFC
MDAGARKWIVAVSLWMFACTRPARIGYNGTSQRGWVFSSSRRTAIVSNGPSVVRTASHALFSPFFPDDCRICAHPVRDVSRIPVCWKRLREPQPLLAEYFCVSCRTPFRNAFPLDTEGRCTLGRTGLRGFDAADCFGAYEETLRELIHLFKYRQVQTLSQPLAEFLVSVLPLDERFDAVILVPLHWQKQWQRGFNQSDLLARVIARRCGIPVNRALGRSRFTGTQAGLSNTERRKNVASAFRCRGTGKTLAGQRVLWIDDMMTTGSTAAACARTLKQAGAARVVLATVARVDRRFESVRGQLIPRGGENVT